MKKENFHRDYIPIKIVDHMKSGIIRGVIVKLRFHKIDTLNILQSILIAFGIHKHKDIYFWLPYKNVVKASNKYGTIGAASRDPYSNC